MTHALPLLLAALLLVPAQAGVHASSDASKIRDLSPGHHAACRHYVNRATFKSRGAGAELVVVLAESCSAAIESLVSDTPTRPAEAVRARAYLDRLAAFKTMIIAMNIERAYGRDASPRATPSRSPGARGGATVGTPVSATGEYLIAREFGLLRALNAWYDTGPDFAGPILPVR